MGREARSAGVPIARLGRGSEAGGMSRGPFGA